VTPATPTVVSAIQAAPQGISPAVNGPAAVSNETGDSTARPVLAPPVVDPTPAALISVFLNYQG
jgi:hypothetical protein